MPLSSGDRTQQPTRNQLYAFHPALTPLDWHCQRPAKDLDTLRCLGMCD